MIDLISNYANLPSIHRLNGVLFKKCRLDHNRRIYLQFINHAKSSDNFQIDCYHNYFGCVKTGGNWKFEYLITRALPQSMHVYKKKCYTMHQTKRELRTSFNVNPLFFVGFELLPTPYLRCEWWCSVLRMNLSLKTLQTF